MGPPWCFQHAFLTFWLGFSAHSLSTDCSINGDCGSRGGVKPAQGRDGKVRTDARGSISQFQPPRDESRSAGCIAVCRALGCDRGRVGQGKQVSGWLARGICKQAGR